MNDENLLINSISSNKRSLTEHFVDYVKKSKCISSKDSSSRGMQRQKKSFSRIMITINCFAHLFQVHYALHIQSQAMITLKLQF